MQQLGQTAAHSDRKYYNARRIHPCVELRALPVARRILASTELAAEAQKIFRRKADDIVVNMAWAYGKWQLLACDGGVPV
jgi:hypothetical protein